MLRGVEVATENGPPYTIECRHLVLAVGHSARDTFQMLHNQGLPMEQKPFSIGARIEHPQSLINRVQYGAAAGHPALGAADYKLNVHLPDGHGVYTFCMCPGGSVVCASSAPGEVVTNGMSAFARAGENANAALLVGIQPEEFGSSHPSCRCPITACAGRKGVLAGRRLLCGASAKGGGFLSERKELSSSAMYVLAICRA